MGWKATGAMWTTLPLVASSAMPLTNSKNCVEWTIESPDEAGIGEVAVRAEHLFQVDADGWRRTGDLGRISDEGYLSLHGRVDDRIIRGGENIYPTELELVLLEHRGVREVAVVGVPDRRWGEIVKAVVVPASAELPPDAEELRSLGEAIFVAAGASQENAGVVMH